MPSNSYEKPDFWSKKAFSEGYPARSVYKLKELDSKFHLLRPGQRVLDLGAAQAPTVLMLAVVTLLVMVVLVKAGVIT